MAMTSEANTEEVFSKVTDSPVPRYICRRVPDGEPNWKETEAAVLADVVTGEAPRYRTQVQACWSERTLYLRFECEDERVVSPYTKRDDPLFEADVVECFIQPGEDGAAYYEFNISPHNIVFDSRIVCEPGKEKLFQPEWDARQLRTTVTYVAEPKRLLVYEAAIAFEDLERAPQPGDCWRINWFRIDEGEDGMRTFDAWSPTGAVNFHVPERFGRFIFEA